MTKIHSAENQTMWPYVVCTDRGRLPVVKVWFTGKPWEACTFLAASHEAIDALIQSGELDESKFVNVDAPVSLARYEESVKREAAFQSDIDSGRAALILGTRNF